MKPGTVFVGEDFDEDDFDMCTGTWSAHWEDGREHRQGPQRVSAQEAIAWGRDQADVVLVRPADSDVHYSAGARRPEPEEAADSRPGQTDRSYRGGEPQGGSTWTVHLMQRRCCGACAVAGRGSAIDDVFHFPDHGRPGDAAGLQRLERCIEAEPPPQINAR